MSTERDDSTQPIAVGDNVGGDSSRRISSVDNFLASLIELSPEFEDENGKGILLGDSKLYVKLGRLFILPTLLIAGMVYFYFSYNIVLSPVLSAIEDFMDFGNEMDNIDE